MKKNKGFTLVEIIVILVILAIMAAILIPSLTTYIDKAKEKQVTANARAAYVAAQAMASEMYALDYDVQPTTGAGGTGATTSVADCVDTNGKGDGAKEEDYIIWLSQLASQKPKITASFTKGTLNEGFTYVQVLNGNTYTCVHTSTGAWNCSKS